MNSRLEKQELDIETLRLQVEKQGGKETQPDETVERLESAQKSEELAKTESGKENLLVLDWVNGEIWNKGARYRISELYNLAIARDWPVEKTLEKRAPDGHARWRWIIRNMSLLRYQNRDRGIFEIRQPAQPNDFEILLTGGFSFQSSANEAKNVLDCPYYLYDGEDDGENGSTIKFKHDRGLDFDDKLEVFFDSSGKITRLRYGVLDEH